MEDSANERFFNEVTKKNASAFHNRAILGLLNNNIGSFVSAVMTNIKFIESDYFSEFAKSIVDVTCKVSKKDIEMKFLEAIVDEIGERKTKISLAKLVKYLSNFDFVAKDDFLKSISQKLIASIIAQTETARKSCITNRQNVVIIGEIFYKNIQDELMQLKEILGVQDFSYANTADKVANEILQCSIDYSNDSQKKNLKNDYCKRAEKLAMLAQSIAVGAAIKERINENLKIFSYVAFDHNDSKITSPHLPADNPCPTLNSNSFSSPSGNNWFSKFLNPIFFIAVSIAVSDTALAVVGAVDFIATAHAAGGICGGAIRVIGGAVVIIIAFFIACLGGSIAIGAIHAVRGLIMRKKKQK